MRAGVDDDRCRGHGICAALQPEIFHLTDDGYAEVRAGDLPDRLAKAVEEAADSCPERAITVL